jgi:predicted glutamine amidotransferase
MVVSEPLDAEEGDWAAVENGHILIARNGAAPKIAEFRPH